MVEDANVRIVEENVSVGKALIHRLLCRKGQLEERVGTILVRTTYTIAEHNG